MFHLKQKNINGEGVALDFSRDGQLLALGINPNPLQFHGVLTLLDPRTLRELQTIEIHDKRLKALKFSLDKKHIYTLLHDDTYDYQLCSIQLSNSKITQIVSYGGTEFWKSLAITDDGHYLAVIGNSVEIWDLKLHQLVKVYDGNRFSGESSLKAQFFSHKLIGMSGLGSHDITVHDFLTGEAKQRFLKPYKQSRQLLVSHDKKMLLVSGIGVGGTFLYDLQTGKRLLEDKFNADTLNSHFLFTINDSHIVRIGLRGFSCINTQDGSYVSGKRYEPSLIMCSASSYATPCFSFVQENHTLNL